MSSAANTTMPTPQTLLQLAEASLAPHRLSKSAVVMIDAQNEYLKGRLPLAGIEATLEERATLLERARGLRRTVVHVTHAGRAGSLFDPAEPGFAITDPVAPRVGERVIRKARPNAFACTELDAALRALGITSLIVAGFMTHLCVSTTVRAALDLGYACTLADIIRKPAERAGLELEEGLVEEILTDAGTDPGTLPLVALCLQALHCLNAPADARQLCRVRALHDPRAHPGGLGYGAPRGARRWPAAQAH